MPEICTGNHSPRNEFNDTTICIDCSKVLLKCHKCGQFFAPVAGQYIFMCDCCKHDLSRPKSPISPGESIIFKPINNHSEEYDYGMEYEENPAIEESKEIETFMDNDKLKKPKKNNDMIPYSVILFLILVVIYMINVN